MASRIWSGNRKPGGSGGACHATEMSDAYWVPMQLPGWPDDGHGFWVYTEHGERLHAVAHLEVPHEEWGSGRGVTVCGFHGYLMHPGVLSRLSMQRCAKCCRSLKVPRGVGHPRNGG